MSTVREEFEIARGNTPDFGGRTLVLEALVFPGANFLLQGQGYHLIHHMAPSVPYYRYEAVFRGMRPLLERNTARIEGLVPDPAHEGCARGICAVERSGLK